MTTLPMFCQSVEVGSSCSVQYACSASVGALSFPSPPWKVLPGRAQFAAVVSGGSHAKVAALVRRHGWTFPVAVDRDLSVFNLYRVAVCPTTVFALPGGTVKSTSIHPLSEAQVVAGLRAIGGA